MGPAEKQGLFLLFGFACRLIRKPLALCRWVIYSAVAAFCSNICFSYAFGILTVYFLVLASGSYSKFFSLREFNLRVKWERKLF
jgi:hypothetical protein